MWPNLLALAGAALLLAIVPGPSTAVILRQALRNGRRAALAATLANEVGALCWALAASFGVSALVAASHVAYDVLRVAGALALVALGVQALWRSRRADSVGDEAREGDGADDMATSSAAMSSAMRAQVDEVNTTPTPSTASTALDTRRGAPRRKAPDDIWQAFRMGLVTTLANPKAAVFAASFLPQFVPAHAPVLATLLLLAVEWVFVDLCWYVVLIWLVSWARNWLTRSTVRRRLEQTTGLALIGFGARLAFERS
ncbi:MAG TPA: LysE family translocator [Ktedonobacterales bacterium]|jgi:threonine/homoserine/homoserine lactone efflux protein|nr:LysE family translocator [Ktedonobacterales bacterium]